MREHPRTTSTAEPAVTASWAGSFCLACDADSHGEPFCSKTCALTETDSCSSSGIASTLCAAPASFRISALALAQPQRRPALTTDYSAARVVADRRRAQCIWDEPPAANSYIWPPSEQLAAPKPAVVCSMRWDIWAHANAEPLGIKELDGMG